MRYDHFSMLPEKAFQPRNGRQGMTLEGGGSGGGGGGPQQVTQTTSNLPEYAKPYFTNLMQRAQAESYREYTPYKGERVAGLTPAQMQIQRDVMAMERPGQFGVGTGLAGAGGMGSLQYGQRAAGAGQQYASMATDPSSIQAYMSPFQQAVTDVAKQSALREAQLAQQQANLGSARQGTYGGARQALAQAERERGLLDRLAQIQAQGSQSAFEAARQAQQYGADLGLKGLGMGLQGAQQSTQAGEALGRLGASQMESDLKMYQAQAAVGEQQRALEQQKLDMDYADFLRQRDYPMEQLGAYSAMLRGLPVQMGSTATSYAPPPSMAQQVVGPGLLGLGLYREFGKS